MGGRAAARPAVLLAVVGLLVSPSIQLSGHPPLQSDPWPILEGASAAYARVQSLSADFVQVISNPMLGEPDTTRGRLFQRRPDRFAMRFTHPPDDRIVADGRHLWLYTPSTTPGQAIRTRIPETGTTGPNLIGQFVERPRARYLARYVGADSLRSGWADVVALTPRDSTLPYADALVWVDRSDSLVHRVDINETSGQRRVVELHRVQVNVPIAAREFRFSPPRGVQVVDQ